MKTKQSPVVFYQKCIPKYFAKFIRKLLYQNFFFNKVASSIVLFLWILQKFNKNFFTEHLQVTASDIRMQVVVLYNLNLSLQFVTINFTFFLSVSIVTRNSIVWKLARGYCLCYCKTFSPVPDSTECTKIFVTEK